MAKDELELKFRCILQLDLSEYELGLLETPSAFVAVGYWRCKECANGFVVPNENGSGPRYCPFCSSKIWED